MTTEEQNIDKVKVALCRAHMRHMINTTTTHLNVGLVVTLLGLAGVLICDSFSLPYESFGKGGLLLGGFIVGVSFSRRSYYLTKSYKFERSLRGVENG